MIKTAEKPVAHNLLHALCPHSSYFFSSVLMLF